MSLKRPYYKMRLPKGWPNRVKSAVFQVISLARYAVAHTRGWAADSVNQRIRLKARLEQANAEIALLREEIRIKDARMALIAPHKRPFYPPTERMAILELKAARGWSLAQAAKLFLVSDNTLASWHRRIDEEGPDALVQLRGPVNKFPDFVRYAIQRLKTLCPTLGKVKIAEMLCRSGLHLGASTVGRILKEEPLPEPIETMAAEVVSVRIVTAKYPNHVWHVDLTVVPLFSGFWTAWMPFSLPQRWPFCWWMAVAEDHFSRKIMGTAVFAKQPTSVEVRTFLGKTMSRAKAKPKHLICDKGVQFWNAGFKSWCKRKNIKPRFGAVGKHGSIAVVERLILTVKTILVHLKLVPFGKKQFQKELSWVVEWYNEHRPHTSLGGGTPNEVFNGLPPANRKPRFEPRAAWPRGSPCAAPRTLVKGKPGIRFKLDVAFYEGRKHLPVIKLRRTG